MSISVTPPDAAVGEHVTVTCSSSGGYPVPEKITFTNSTGIIPLRNGQPHVFPVRSLEDAGLVRCILKDVTTQPSMSATLSVYHKPHIVEVQNATVVRGSRDTVTISCSVRNPHCRTVVQFFKDGREIRDSEQTTHINDVPRGNDTFTHYLIISDASEKDEGRYVCQVYANYTTPVLVSEQEMFVRSVSLLPPNDPEVNEANTESPECDCVSKHFVIGVAVLVVCVLLVIAIGAVVLLFAIRRARYVCRSSKKDIVDVNP